MTEQRIQRRLAAILAADMVGYSRAMSEDELGTLGRLKAVRAEIFDPAVQRFGGRIFKTTGDGALAEFASAIEAVQCAIAVQRRLADLNEAVGGSQRITLRIGISLGDVIVDGDDLYGNGVNVAARMEALAKPGTICISGNIHEQCRHSLDLAFEDLGEQVVKNLDRPIRSYRVRLEGRSGPEDEVAPKLPDKPSIAILPFQNMSGDQEQEYFADGITEDIITALSRIRWLFVIARNSTFVYKGRAVDVKQAARELGVRYVLEGSVRKMGNRVRITAQLIDALSAAHHWAERYDRDLTDIFAVQDEITRNVAAAIEPRLLAAEGLRTQNRPPADLDMVARGMARYWRLTGADVEAAIGMLREAIARYPDYAPARSMLAFCLVLAGHFGWLPSFEVPALAVESAWRAMELDDNDPWAYLALGYVAFVDRRTDESISHFRRAIELNPNFAAAYGYLGYPLAFDARAEEAIENLLLAMRMSPHDRQNAMFMSGLAVAYYTTHRYDQAIEWGRKGVQQGAGNTGAYRILCASLAQAGRLDEARAVLDRLRSLQPHISLDWVARMVPYTAAHMPHFLDGLRKAGLT